MNSMTDAELRKVVQIAKEKMPALQGRADLETMNSGDLDFLDVAVWTLKEALMAAYEAGKADGQKANQ
jgi:hypothetical protein